MKKLLLSLLALGAVCLVTTQVQAEKERYARTHHLCRSCGATSDKCGCHEKVDCIEEVVAIRRKPLKEKVVRKEFCPEGATAKYDENDNLHCIEIIATEKEVDKECVVERAPYCEPGFHEAIQTRAHNMSDRQQRKMDATPEATNAVKTKSRVTRASMREKRDELRKLEAQAAPAA